MPPDDIGCPNRLLPKRRGANDLSAKRQVVDEVILRVERRK